jgi:hypothetical protein
MRTRFAACLLALIYVTALPGLLPVAFAALAAAEGSHGIDLRTRGAETCVVLTHRLGCAVGHDATHRHGVLARVLTVTATREGSDPDHVVHFVSGQVATAEKRPSLLEPERGNEIPAPSLDVTTEVAAPRREAAPVAHCGAPRRPPAQLAALRSTLLVI